MSTVMVVALGVGLAGCSGDGMSSSSTSVSPAGTGTTTAGFVADVTQPPVTRVGVPPLPAVTAPADVTREVTALLDKAAPQLVLEPDQRACVTAKLHDDPILVSSLGDDPMSSPRWTDLVNLSATCIRSVTMSADFAADLQEQAGGKLNVEQLSCARQAIADLTDEDVQGIMSGDTSPGTPGSIVRSKLDALLSDCGIDVSTLAPVPAPVPPTDG